MICSEPQHLEDSVHGEKIDIIFFKQNICNYKYWYVSILHVYTIYVEITVRTNFHEYGKKLNFHRYGIYYKLFKLANHEHLVLECICIYRVC